jgi:hypothetical protein
MVSFDIVEFNGKFLTNILHFLDGATIKFLLKRRRSRVDLLGLCLYLLPPAVYSFSFASFMFVYLQLDPLYAIWPDCPLLLRTCLVYFSIVEIVCAVATGHLVNIAAVLHTKELLQKLRWYKPKKGSKIKGIVNAKRATNGNSYVKLNISGLSSDVQLYYLLMFLFKRLRQYFDPILCFAMGTGLLIDMIANYAVVMLYGVIPMYLYFYAVLLAIIAPLIIMALVPQGAASDVESSKLLKVWMWKPSSANGSKRWRKSMRFRYVRSLAPVMFGIGPFFCLRRGTLSTYLDTILNYTISAILAFPVE